MKPYRGTFVLAAVLLAALPLAGCGDSDDWQKTTEITLSSNVDSVEVKGEVIFTVQSPPPELTEGYQCETDLEYRAEGAGLDAYWHTVPGAGPTRVFVLEPRIVEQFAVLARGKCIGAKEDWKYSNQVDIKVTEVELPVVSGVTLTATPSSVSGGAPVVFTVSVTKEADCNLSVKTVVNGNTYTNFTDPTWSTTSGGTYSLPTFSVLSATSLVISTEAYCTQNASVRESASVSVSVTP